jgi:hypothetical protein
MSVYFITCRTRGICKIGVAQDANKRRSSLQTASPHKLVLEATLPGSQDLERQLHKRFSDCRMSGEWFRITDELDALIKESSLVECHEMPSKAREEQRRQSFEEFCERDEAKRRQMFAEAMSDFAKLGPAPPMPPLTRRRFYNPVPASGGQWNQSYGIRGEGGHRHRVFCTDMGLTWDQADRLCDVLEQVRQYALEEGVES